MLVVFLHDANIIACTSDEIDSVDETGSRLIGPTSEVSDRVDVFDSRKFGVSTGNDYR